MKARLCLAAMLLSVVWPSFAQCANARDVGDAAAVRAVALQQADAWSRHDAAAYSALFTPDCDVVNIVGWWWKSRAEMQAKLARAFSSVFRDSTLTFTDVHVRFLTPDIAVAHAAWTMTGMHVPSGMPLPDRGIQTLVLTRHDGRWSIAAFQNTLSKPEHPFPAKSAAARAASTSAR